VYNIGQKLGLWLGPHYIIAEMGTKSSSSKEPRQNNIADLTTKRNRSSSMTPQSYMSSVASSITNLSSLDDAQVPYHNNSLGGIGNIDQPSGESSGGGGGGFSSSDDQRGPEGHKSKKKSSSRITNASPWSSAKIVATIPSRWPLSICYMHSFSLTHSYFVLVEQPLSIYLPSFPLHQIYGDKPIASCLKFYPEEDTLFHVVSRHSRSSGKSYHHHQSQRKTFRSSSFFFLHTINAFEMRNGDSDETFIVIDICTYKNPAMIECMYVDALKVTRILQRRSVFFQIDSHPLKKISHTLSPL